MVALTLLWGPAFAIWWPIAVTDSFPCLKCEPSFVIWGPVVKSLMAITQHLYNCRNRTILLHCHMIFQHSCTIVALCDDSQHKPTTKISSLSYSNVRSSRHMHHPLLLQYSQQVSAGSLVPSLFHLRWGWHSCLILMLCLTWGISPWKGIMQKLFSYVAYSLIFCICTNKSHFINEKNNDTPRKSGWMSF